MTGQRRSGVLLHPTALPSPYACGDLGQEAYRFVDFLARAKQRLWQVLPLSPPGFADSPYSSLSAFAGNLGLISLESLVESGELLHHELPARESEQLSSRLFKRAILKHAAQRFSRTSPDRRRAFDAFCARSSDWLEDYVLFVALHEQFGHRSWEHWPVDVRLRHPAAVTQWRKKLAMPLKVERYAQFVFFEQWQRLKDYAHGKGILLCGDIPLFVAYDSADVWSAPHRFQLDTQRQPTAVAGVPPDFFSETGQRWGNPLYDWSVMQEEDFSWWLSRLSWGLDTFDMLRFDHFRGLSACWSIPSTAPDARDGHWETVPGRHLLEKLYTRYPNARLIAEDLGTLTPEVEQLRHDFALPGMNILQFAFDSDAQNPYLPGNLEKNSVVYTGTHDNDTTMGWWWAQNPAQKQRVRELLGQPCDDMPWDLIRVAMQSRCNICITPLTDLLELGSEARFNRPGISSGNWRWRIPMPQLSPALADRLAEITCATNR